MPKLQLRQAALALFAAVLVPACNQGSTPPLPLRGFAAPVARVDRGTQNQFFAGNYDCCQDGLTVYAVWTDNRNGDPTVYFNRSFDSGVRWGAADVRIDHAPPASSATAPHIANSGSRVYAVWMDNRNGSYDLWLNFSADGGMTWQAADTRLDTGLPAADSYWPLIAASGSTVAVVWNETVGEGDLFTNVSSDGGATWQAAAVRVDRAPAGLIRRDPHLCCSASGVFVCWTDFRNGPSTDIYFNRTADGGATWLVNDVRLDTDTAGANASLGAQIACSGSTVYVAWADERTGGRIAFNRSTDAGLTWLANDLQIDHAPAGGATGYVQLRCDGMTVVASWVETPGGGNNLYFNRSTDGGLTWMPTDIRIDSHGASGSAQEVIMANDGPNVVLVWVDTRTPVGAYFNQSTDGGLTWLTEDVKANPGPEPFYIPRVTAGAGQACVLWIQDDAFPARSIRSIRWFQ